MYMESEVIGWLNQNFGAGTFIAIFVVIIALLTGLCKVGAKILSWILTKHKSYIEKKYTRKKEQDDFRNDMLEMAKEVKELKQSMTDIKEHMAKNENETKDKINEITLAISASSQERKETEKEIELMSEKITLLIDSDKDQIKSTITSEYHKWMELEYIDMYSMETIESQYDKYRKEKGNTFVEELVKELRKLPKRPKYDNPNIDNKWKVRLQATDSK